MHTSARIRVKRKAVVDLNQNIVHSIAPKQKSEKDINGCTGRYYFREY